MSEKKSASWRKKLLITGGSGYTGKHLSAFFQNQFEVHSKRVEITDRKKIATYIKKVSPDFVMHTAAISNLKECENNPQKAHQVNVEGTKNIVNAIKKNNKETKFIFFSSDYVFKGDKGNYKENDKREPTTMYGKTKKEAEDYIQTHLKNYLIVRTANVFGKNGGNFFNFLITQLEKNEVTEVRENIVYTPTYITHLLYGLKMLMEKDVNGLFHIAGSEKLSRFSFAQKLSRTLGKKSSLIKPEDRTQKNKTLFDVSLNTQKIQEILGGFSLLVDQAFKFEFNDFLFPYFYFRDSRGVLRGINQGYSWKEINHIGSVKGTKRGNHYHKVVTEGFYIIQGTIAVKLYDVKRKKVQEFTAQKGDAFIIKPFVAHTFKLLTDAQWINMLSHPIDNNNHDFYRYDLI